MLVQCFSNTILTRVVIYLISIRVHAIYKVQSSTSASFISSMRTKSRVAAAVVVVVVVAVGT